MATFHFSIKTGGRGTAAQHAAYIGRTGKYLQKLKQNDLGETGHGNMPDFAKDDPNKLWKGADEHERKNGSTYREFEVALPNELEKEQQAALVNDFIQTELSGKPYQFAIHRPNAALGSGRNDHAHIMVSDRKPDGIARDVGQHFSRYNPQQPELGGCKKLSGGKSPGQIRSEAQALRGSWADLVNKHLEQNGHPERVDHRSHRDRGLENAPGTHLGPLKAKRLKASRNDGKPNDGV